MTKQSIPIVGEERPKWQKKAKCRGMLKEFTDATYDEQRAVCCGETAPWDTPCPVLDECLSWFINRCVELDNIQTAYDNVIVHGGLEPWELLKVAQLEARRRRESREGYVQRPSRRSKVPSSAATQPEQKEAER